VPAYAKVFRSIWQDDDFRALTGSTQRMYILLMTQPDVSHCGVLPYTPGRWGQLASDTDADSVRHDIEGLTVPETLGLTVKPFVLIDAGTEELLIRSYAKHDGGYKVPNIRTALFRSIEEVMSAPLRSAAAHLLVTLGLTVPETVWPSQQQQPAPAANTSSSSQQPDRSPNGSLPDAAAAAIEIILDIRREQEGTAVRNAQRWRTKTRPLLVTEFRERLLSCNGATDPRDLVLACGFSVVDIARAVNGAS
jgi:hypothetical protein